MRHTCGSNTAVRGPLSVCMQRYAATEPLEFSNCAVAGTTLDLYRPNSVSLALSGGPDRAKDMLLGHLQQVCTPLDTQLRPATPAARVPAPRAPARVAWWPRHTAPSWHGEGRWGRRRVQTCAPAPSTQCAK